MRHALGNKEVAIIFFALVTFFFAGFICCHSLDSPSGVGDGLPAPKGEHTFEDLLDAIEWVESKGDADAVGDNGRAVGAYQIHSCYVEDATSYQHNPFRFKDKDRLDKEKSREMIRRYMSHYAAYHRIGRYPTLEDMARIHNGGPDGWEKESTLPYWEKVKARLYRTDKRNL
jgi:hypothetical protein